LSNQQTGNLHFGDGTFFAGSTDRACSAKSPGIAPGIPSSRCLVYQTPKADLIIFVQKRLKNTGLSQEEIVAFSFSSNTAIPLSLQVTAVKDLEALGKKALPHRRFPTKIVD
jgi:hypothetical protein